MNEPIDKFKIQILHDMPQTDINTLKPILPALKKLCELKHKQILNRELVKGLRSLETDLKPEILRDFRDYSKNYSNPKNPNLEALIKISPFFGVTSAQNGKRIQVKYHIEDILTDSHFSNIKKEFDKKMKEDQAKGIIPETEGDYYKQYEDFLEKKLFEITGKKFYINKEKETIFGPHYSLRFFMDADEIPQLKRKREKLQKIEKTRDRALHGEIEAINIEKEIETFLKNNKKLSKLKNEIKGLLK